ncbi:hypothetical protein ACJX0J_014239, partial [Zea mays]
MVVFIIHMETHNIISKKTKTGSICFRLYISSLVPIINMHGSWPTHMANTSILPFLSIDMNGILTTWLTSASQIYINIVLQNMIIWDNGYQLLVYTMRVLFLHLSAAGNTSIFVHTNVYTNLSLRCMYFVQ